MGSTLYLLIRTATLPTEFLDRALAAAVVIPAVVVVWLPWVAAVLAVVSAGQ